MTPLIFRWPESIGKEREFGEHRGEPLDQGHGTEGISFACNRNSGMVGINS